MRSRPTPSLRAIVIVLVAAACGDLLVGCGDDLPARRIPDDSRRNVMVIDNGIDPTLPALQGKVAATYTVACDPKTAAPGGTGDLGMDGSTDLDAAKAELIAQLAQPDESCHLRDGIDAKPAFGTAYLGERQRWNDALFEDRDPFVIASGLSEALDEELDTLPFHGTATAGTIAFAAPQLQMVLVEEPLLSADDVAAQFTCPTQASIDTLLALLSDAEVRAAYLAQPLPSIDRELAALRASRGVALVNESFGPVTRFGFEQLLLRANCLLVDVADYFQVIFELVRSYEQAHAEPEILFVRSAGNDGAALNDGDDGAQCRPGDEGQVLVGAYGLDGKRSTFTNFGGCVDVYAPGEYVVVPLPGDWLAPLSGTSFAAPLLARLLLFDAPEPFAPASARAFLAATREPNRNITVSRFPPELVFDLRAAAATRQSALTSATTSVPTTDSSRMPSARALRRLLWPLIWAERALQRP